MATKTFTNNGQGRLYVAPKDTAVPDTFAEILTAVTATSGAFKECADIHKDGLTITPRAIDTENENWNGETIRQDVHSEWQFKAMDFLNDEAVKTIYGAGNVTVTTTGGTVDMIGEMAEPVVLVAIMKDGDKGVAAVCRNAKATALDAYKFTKGELSTHSVTMKSVIPASGKCSYMAWERDLDGDTKEE